VHVRDGVDAVPPARNPKVVDALAARFPLYETLLTVAVVPLVLSVPLQI
jgi:hypothetical protein